VRTGGGNRQGAIRGENSSGDSRVEPGFSGGDSVDGFDEVFAGDVFEHES
jgi:hypothetical protein